MARNITFKNFFILIITLTLTNSSVFAFGEYTEQSGSTINFSDDKKSQNFSIQRELFIRTFDEEYKDIEPPKIKPHFKSRGDITNWLSNVFDIEHKYFTSAKHPMNWITIEKNSKIIGFVMFEQWKNKADTWHIRQMAVIPAEQRKGYGTRLIKSILKLRKNIKKIIVDTRYTNIKAIDSYKKNGFKITETPHDKELSKDLYLGLYNDKLESLTSIAEH